MAKATPAVPTYTQEQLDIAVLKNTNDGVLRTLSDIKSEIKSQFPLVIGLILGIYGMITAAAFAKIMGMV